MTTATHSLYFGTRRISFKRYRAAIFLAMMFFLKPASFLQLAPAIETLFDAGRLLSFLVLTIIWAAERHNYGFILALAAVQSTMLYSTIVHNGDVWKGIVLSASRIGIVLLGITNAKNPKPLFDALGVLAFIYIAINLATQLLVPEGLYLSYPTNNPCYFLGHRNNASALMAVMALCVALRAFYLYGRITTVGLMAIILAYTGIILTWSATVLVAFTVGVALLFLCKYKKPIKIMNANLCLAISLVFTVLFSILQLQHMFAFLIEDILRKSLSFTGRTSIWERAIYYISQSPLIGWGHEYTEIIYSKLILGSAHNTWMDYMYTGGIMATIPIIGLMLYSGAKLTKKMNTPFGKCLFAIVVFFYVYFIAQPSDHLLEGILFIVLLLCCSDAAKPGDMPERTPAP